MTFKVLTAHGDDGKAWDAYISMLPFDLRDIHFSSAWGRVQETMGGTAQLAVWEDERGYIVCQPFMVRPIRDGLMDTAAIGYGGPLTSDAMPDRGTADLMKTFLGMWQTDNSVVSDFYLINPALASHQWIMTTPGDLPVRSVVILPVGDGFLDRLAKTRRPTMKMAAAKATVHVTSTPTADDISAFATAYSSQMEKLAASSRWRFDPAYFERLFAELNGFAVYARATIGTSTAMAIFLLGRDVAYYYLATHSGKRVNGLGDVAIMLGEGVARKHGCTWLHLGGGTTSASDDPLFRYKRSFGGLVRPVFGVGTIVDHEAYARLTEGRPQTSFFPAYRVEAHI